MEIKEKLMADAKQNDICAEGYSHMRASDRNMLIEYYVANPDWCLERNFPQLEVLTEHFSDCEDKGVYVNKTFKGELLNDLQVYVFHHCKGTIKVGLNVEKAILPMLYIANGCRLRIVGVGQEGVSRPSGIPIYIFGKNDLSARNNRYVKFTKYSQDII